MADSSYSNPNASAMGGRRIGSYVILKSLGRGGMGEVFQAHDPIRNRMVAIKTMDPREFLDEEKRQRLEREARTTIGLDHVGIARNYGLEYDNQRRPFLVMEFVEGEPLESVIRSGVQLRFSQMIDYILQTARALEAAHRRSVIHRDVKPANLLVTEEGQIKIIDFGLAKSIWEQVGLTRSGRVVGTPRYISPEQALGRPVDHRSDIYSLGATFYELVTRQAPFDGDTPTEIMQKHVGSTLIPPYMINPNVPVDVSEIICRMMNKDPNERYPDYEPLIRDLESAMITRLAKERRRFGESTGEAAAQAPPSHDDTDIDSMEEPAELEEAPLISQGLVTVRPEEMPEEALPSRLRMGVLTGVGVLILAIAVGGWFYSRHQAEEPGREPSWIARQLGRWLGSGSEGAASGDRLVIDDATRIQTTLGRMQVAVSKIMQYRRAHGGEIPTIRGLREQRVLTQEDSRDEWGNNFVLSSASDGRLIAAGRDCREGTADDFILGLDGSEVQVPKHLTAEDLAISK